MPSRYICTVLDEMRTCHKTQNYSYLIGLIEEAQILANRMEAALWEQKAFDRRQEEHRELKKEKKKLEEDIKKLEEEKEANA